MKFLLYFILTINTTVLSQQLFEKQVYPFDGLDVDYFGRSIAASDSFLFISSFRYENTINAAVYFYKFENNDYHFETKIYPNDPDEGALFSSEILFEDDHLLVGAQNKKINNMIVGALYFFKQENDNWVEKQVIYPPEPRTERGLFSNVIIKHQNFLLVSAFKADTIAENVGKVFMYEYVGDHYELFRVFAPHDPKADQSFGTSLLMDDNLIIIGSQSDSTSSGYKSGSIYVYEKIDSVWEFSKKYIPEPNPDQFSYGCALAKNDEYIVVGTSDNLSYQHSGQAYIYTYSGPNLELVQIISTGDYYLNDRFGTSLSISSDSLLVGSRSDTVQGSYPGTVYLFVNNKGTWEKRQKIFASNGTEGSFFGGECILRNGKIFAGAHLQKVNNYFTGAVYIYTPDSLTQIQEIGNSTVHFRLNQNYPNPFNSQTKISFYLPQKGRVILNVFDSMGQEIFTPVEEIMYQGTHEILLNFDELSSGVYFYRLEYFIIDLDKTEHSTLTKKAIFVK